MYKIFKIKYYIHAILFSNWNKPLFFFFASIYLINKNMNLLKHSQYSENII